MFVTYVCHDGDKINKQTHMSNFTEFLKQYVID